jgi:hypothetical protein
MRFRCDFCDRNGRVTAVETFEAESLAVAVKIAEALLQAQPRDHVAALWCDGAMVRTLTRPVRG